MVNDYNPVQTVAPQTSSPDNYLSVRATPDAFGAQVGEATQRLGATVQQAAANQMDVQIAKQKLFNDAAVANKETELNSQFGDINGWYKSLENQEAVAAYPEAQKRLQKVRQDLRTQLPNDAARRSFDLIAARTEGFELRDLGGHRATQEKSYVRKSNEALRQNFIDQFTRPEIAVDDRQSGYIEGSIKNVNEKIVQDYGWDLNTKEGQTVLAAENDKTADLVWTNITKALAFGPHGDPVAAVDKLTANKDSIPAATLNKLYQMLDNPYRAAQTRQGETEIISEADSDYNKSITTKSELPDITPGKESLNQSQPVTTSGQILNTFRQQEGGPLSNKYQIMPGTWVKFAGKNEKIDVPEHNEIVASRILDKYIQDYHGDLDRIAVAYFSGSDNVAAPDSKIAWKEDKEDKSHKKVSSYVADIRRIQGQISQPAETVSAGTVPLNKNANLPVFRSKAEYFSINQDKLIKKAEDWAQKNFPNDLQVRDQVVSRVTQHINRLQNVERERQSADNEAVYRFVFGEGRDGQLISHVSDIENGPQEVRDAWNRMDSLKQQAIQTRILTANSSGKALEYGTDFWKYFEDTVTGKVTSVAQLYNVVGPNRNSALTNTGLAQIAKIKEIGSTPEGAALLHSMRGYFEKMRSQMVGSTFGRNANGERIFQRAMIQDIPKIFAGRSQGLGAGDLFDEDSSNYLGGARAHETRNQAQIFQDYISTVAPITMDTLTGKPYQAEVKPFDFKQLDAITDPVKGREEITKYIKQRPLTPEEYDFMVKYAVQRGWARSTPPSSVPGAR